eukprot:352436-Chlamydomonas_euryale.AAC.1
MSAWVQGVHACMGTRGAWVHACMCAWVEGVHACMGACVHACKGCMRACVHGNKGCMQARMGAWVQGSGAYGRLVHVHGTPGLAWRARAC